METNRKVANQQAFELQLSFERRAQLLTFICRERVAVEHYVPEVSENVHSGIDGSTFHVAYRHLSHYISPSKNPIFQHKETNLASEVALSISIDQVIHQLREFQAGKAPNEAAATEASNRIRVYCESAKFLALIHHNGLAILDYVPKVSFGFEKNTKKTICSVAYGHRYFLSRAEKDRNWLVESTHENLGLGLLYGMNDIVRELKLASDLQN
jgi:hypothetical protein